MLGLDLGNNDYYYHKKGRGNGRVTADPMVLWALAHIGRSLEIVVCFVRSQSRETQFRQLEIVI